ncbi:MAG: beta-ketoacyl-ACP synthase II, partial [Oscillospiraceae bacterium]|nr:beta-ketoacyl-ACP synthase II [Oscillospiraceae bacterium]
LDPYRVGVIIGCGIGGLELTNQEHAKYLEKGPGKISVFYVPMMIGNMAAGTIAMKTGFKGDNFATVTACASSTHAIGEAFRKIKDGYIDAALCGGTESCITKFALGGFNNMKALSRSTDLERCSIPFDKERNGFVLGEGSAVLVLEEYEHAVARGAKIYAEIAGYGATGDAYHMTSPSPEGDAAARAMVNAYTEAGLKAEDVTYVNAHGTSTGLNDKYETTAIKKAFGAHAANLKINSTKSMLGHLLGAAGAVEAVATALQMQHGLIHQTVGYKVPDEECDLFYCTEGNIKTEIKAAISNSLGFGGHNATLCFKSVK